MEQGKAPDGKEPPRVVVVQPLPDTIEGLAELSLAELRFRLVVARAIRAPFDAARTVPVGAPPPGLPPPPPRPPRPPRRAPQRRAPQGP